MKAYATSSRKSGYKLAQLCEASDFHPSTIHYYVKIGLLHKPKKIGLGLYLYDDTHLKTLTEIRSLRERENLSLSKIKDRLHGDSKIDPPSSAMGKEDATPTDLHDLQDVEGTQRTEITRKRVMDVAIELFSKKGYEGTTISDITQALGMSKGSFYLYFKDKRQLFIDCIERLTYVIVPKETWEEILTERDYVRRQAKRIVGLLEAFPSYGGILNLLRMAVMGQDSDLTQKAEEAFAKIVKPIRLDFRRALAQGIVREVDEEFFAHLVLATAESMAYKLMTAPDADRNECVEKCIDLIARGVLPQAGVSDEAVQPRCSSGVITDVKGEKVKVGDIYFGGKPYLVGRIGEGEIRVDTERIAFILLDHTAPDCIAEVTTMDGEKTKLEQDGNMIVSAASFVGLYTIPFRRIRSISFA